MDMEMAIQKGKKYKLFLRNTYKFEGVVIAVDFFFIRLKDIKDGETIIPLKDINRIEEVQ